MKLLQLVLAVSLVVPATAAALPAAGAATRTIPAAGPVRALATVGAEVVFAAEVPQRPGGRSCFEIRVWDVTDRGVRRYGAHCFVSTSTGSGVAQVAVANRRALWLTYTGGNIREWSLWTRTRSTSPRRIRFVSAAVDGPPGIVLGSAWEGSLPYAIGRRIVVLRPDGSRRFALDAPERVVALSAHTRGYAAVLASGSVLTIGTSGRPLREHELAAGEAEAAVLAAPGLLVKTARALELRNGLQVERFDLPAGSRFLGFSEGVVAYGAGAQVRLLRPATGRDVLFRSAPRGFEAQLGRLGLGLAAGARVSFDSWSAVSLAARS